MKAIAQGGRVPNARAMALYERLGFRIEGRRARAYMVAGQPVDDYVMGNVFNGKDGK